MSVVYIVCFTILLAAGLMALYRVERGPSMFDRILAIDVITAVLVGTVALIAAATKRGDLVPVLIVLALVGFIGSVSIARFAAAESAEEGRILTKDELEEIMAQREAQTDDADNGDDEDSGAFIVAVEADDDEDRRRKDR